MILIHLPVFCLCELVSVTTLARHGERTSIIPLGIYTDPQDPQPGHLTELGLQMQYVLGKRIRDHYIKQNFFPEKYNSNNFYIRASPFPRTQQSAQAHVIGYFRDGTGPDNIHTFPIQTDLYEEEWLFTAHDACPRSLENKRLFKESTKYTEFMASLKPDFEEASAYFKTEINESNYHDANDELERKAYRGLITDEAEKKIAKAMNAAKMNTWFHQFDFENNVTVKMVAGILLGELFYENLNRDVSDYQHKTKTSDINAENPNDALRKVRLYLGHDINTWNLLNIFGNRTTHIPDYASSIITELHVENNEPFIQIYYVEEVPIDQSISLEKTWVPITPKGCPAHKCPLGTFQEQYRNYSVYKDKILEWREDICQFKDFLVPLPKTSYKGGPTNVILPLFTILAILFVAVVLITILTCCSKRQRKGGYQTLPDSSE
ncbi:hypothetical protein BLNAU_11885 [Blattamonas nauphoetae]|uniref:Acid phosphatase n=1 Tax=Blattamonas nauphoetae TaxID=2049346 RepID=A0ABQ9XPH6_9EUKA|nr:hypothetical protein BLNAU_11885 [Blattamonas nauphoetae]